MPTLGFLVLGHIMIVLTLVLLELWLNLYSVEGILPLNCAGLMLVNVVSGVEFYLRNASIPTDGSGRLLITDIRLHNEQSSDEDALICRSSEDIRTLRTILSAGDWYLDPELGDTTTTLNSGRRISGRSDRGWTRNRGRVNISSVIHHVVRLRRMSETAVEGKFTCHIPNDSNNNKSLLILYPSELMVFPHT